MSSTDDKEDEPTMPGYFSVRPATPPTPTHRPTSTPCTANTPSAGFPRTDWTGQPPPPFFIARRSKRALDRIEYAARLASLNWALLADERGLHLIDEDMYRLAVLDKAFELNVQRRLSGVERARNFHAWRALAAGFVDEAMALARGAVPPERRPSAAEEEDIRAFVTATKDFGFRSWADAWGGVPPGWLETFDYAALGRYDPARGDCPVAQEEIWFRLSDGPGCQKQARDVPEDEKEADDGEEQERVAIAIIPASRPQLVIDYWEAVPVTVLGLWCLYGLSCSMLYGTR